MRSKTMLFVSSFALLLVGCTSRSQFPGTGLGCAFWAGPESPYGDTTASYGVWGDGMAFVVWSNLPASNGHSFAGDKEVVYSGRHWSPDGRAIDFRCTTADGKTGIMTIAGQQFKLEALVVCQVDASHAALAEFGEELVAAQLRQRQGIGLMGGFHGRLLVASRGVTQPE